MRKFYALLVALLGAVICQGQTVTLVSPEGLTPPYELSPGTEVTVEYDFWGDEPTVLMHDQEPDLTGFGLDPSWSQNTNSTNNGDGTFSYTFTLNEETWIWGGVYMSFLMNWNFSNIIHLGIASGVMITYTDGVVCGDGSDTELLTVNGTFDTYQWYMNNVAIDGATSNTFAATSAGMYKVEVTSAGNAVFSNTLTITEPTIQISGDFTAGDNEIDMSGTAGFDTYQWWSGPSADNLTEVGSATGMNYTVALPEMEMYYAVSGTVDGCTVVSEALPISLDAFATPVITVSADTNSFGHVCNNTTVTLMAGGNYGTYEWWQNGMNNSGSWEMLSLYGDWQNGSYTIEVSPVGWPEISITSAPVSVSYYTVMQPDLIVSPNGPYCAGTQVTVLLSDEGYNYTWYEHTNFTPTEEDIVPVPGFGHSLTFEGQVNVTVQANYQGCSSSYMTTLYDAADANLNIALQNWDQLYLCTDSMAYLEVSQWNVDDFVNYQWYEEIDGELQAIDGATGSTYAASSTGIYAVSGDLVACAGVEIMSNPMEIYDFSERELYIYADMDLLCMGEETHLNISGGEEWQNIQWFKREIQMGTQGYEEVFTPLINGGTDPIQMVNEFNFYLAKARHISCPTGVKITSNEVSIRPLVNPSITVDPNYGIESLKPSPYGDIEVYLYCAGEAVDVSVPDTYDSYSWHMMGYSGDGGYYLGDATPGADEASNTFLALGADWVTAQVDSAGCIGVSDPVLLDTWVFQNPAIASYGNAELCGAGDSTLIHVAFQGNYAAIEWYHNGTLMPEETNDSLWATIPGQYVVTVYREECPDFGMSSGVGPVVTYLQASIMENDTVIWAMPHEGFYDFQWYLNGEPFGAPAQTPWILYKDEMPDGEYTVEVTNPEDCTSLSGPYNWINTSVKNPYELSLELYPNPTNSFVLLKGIDLSLVQSVRILDLNGRAVSRTVLHGNRVDMQSLSEGVYIVEVATRDGFLVRSKVVKNN